MRLSLVAIVGRQNVGKSTLVNRIATGQQAIVDERAGITRDRNYIQADWRGRCFTLIDTGGLDFARVLSISEAVTKQALLAVEEADVIIFVVDGTTGPLPDDEEVSKILRVSKKPVFLVVNKIDHPSRELAKYAFYELGLGDPWEVSALHGLGIGDFLDELVKSLPPEAVEAEEEALSIAIVGHPNVGKSSILNRLLGWERVIVSEVPGTTRDAVDTILERDGKRYRFIDTAGLRRRKKLRDVEYYGFVRTLRALDGASLALIVLDAAEGATEQDQKIAELAEGKGCASIILVNKWDLIEGEEAAQSAIQGVNWRMRFINYSPKLLVSALTGRGIEEIYPIVDRVAEEYLKRVPTPQLNVFVQRLREEEYVPSRGGERLKIFYATQFKTAPPGFVFFVNHPQVINTSYRRYLENKLRESFGFMGCPLGLRFRKKQSKGRGGSVH